MTPVCSTLRIMKLLIFACCLAGAFAQQRHYVCDPPEACDDQLNYPARMDRVGCRLFCQFDDSTGDSNITPPDIDFTYATTWGCGAGCDQAAFQTAIAEIGLCDSESSQMFLNFADRSGSTSVLEASDLEDWRLEFSGDDDDISDAEFEAWYEPLYPFIEDPDCATNP